MKILLAGWNIIGPTSSPTHCMAKMIEQSVLRSQIIMGCEGEDVAMSCPLTLYLFRNNQAPIQKPRDEDKDNKKDTEREIDDKHTEGEIERERERENRERSRKRGRQQKQTKSKQQTNSIQQGSNRESGRVNKTNAYRCGR